MNRKKTIVSTEEKSALPFLCVLPVFTHQGTKVYTSRHSYSCRSERYYAG